MKNEPKQRDLSQRVKVASINRKVDRGDITYEVEVAFLSGGGGKAILTYRTEIDGKEFDEENVIKIARNFFHKLCTALGEDTRKWNISEEEFESLKIQEN